MSEIDGDARARGAADAVARRSYGKLVAFLAARTRDVAAAEDALAEAFAAALRDWPANGCPRNPEAWLLTAARRRIIDGVRRRRSRELVAEQLRLLVADGPAAEVAIPDQRLALMFACAHPAIEIGVRAPLILQTVLGLDAATIASAFLVAPATMSQRLVRAKGKIRHAGIPLRIPERDELPERLEAVLDAIYAAFAEGWSDPVGTDVARRDLGDEALYLGGVVIELLPQSAEALGLMALMLHAEARRLARRDPHGAFIPLDRQDTTRWDARRIDQAETLLLRASRLGSIGRYQLEGALQSAHVHRRRSGLANWIHVVELYDALLAIAPSPVVVINRALALAERDGPDAGLRAMREVAEDPRLAQYQPYWAARADLLARTGRASEAHHAYDVAIGLERDPAVRAFLQSQQRGVSKTGFRQD